MISGFFGGISSLIESLKYLFKPFALKYLLFSGIISLLCFSSLSYLIYNFSDSISSNLLSMISENPSNFITNSVSWLIKAALWLILFFVFKYIVLIITAPLMSALSERLELEILGEVYDDNPNQIYTFFRGIRIAISNLFREVLYTLPLLLLGLIPGVFIFTSILIFLIQAYYAGFGHFDFYLERRFRVKESRQFINKNKWLAITLGAAFLALFLIPFVGAFFAPTFVTIAATIQGIKLIDYD